MRTSVLIGHSSNRLVLECQSGLAEVNQFYKRWIGAGALLCRGGKTRNSTLPQGKAGENGTVGIPNLDVSDLDTRT